ncbi:MAG: MmcQ/YjbR family DNA-binding protein [Pseudomonadales bacterium]|nr:MmcQ/YjbR family DNA-binding protein [Pseudomonadales bacterium]
MNYDAARLYLLARPEAREDFPFGPDTAVMKIGGKMFATLGRTDGAASMNLKCDPDEAVMLRDIFDAVRPGYHMNKRHWNTVILDGSIPRGEIERMIDNSFSLVVKGLPRAERQALEIRHGKGALYPQHNTGSTSG